MSGAPVLRAAIQGTPLVYLALVAWNLAFLGPLMLVTLKNKNCQLFYQQKIGLFRSQRELLSEGGFRFGTHPGDYRQAPKGHRLEGGAVGAPSWHIPSALLQFTSNCQEGAYILTWSPDFCDYCQRDTSRSPGSGSHQGFCMWSHRTVYMLIV